MSTSSGCSLRASLPPQAIVKAVVPAAGLGTRLRPLTRAFPKELLPVGREPVLSYIVTELREAGITDALFIVSTGKPQIREFFGDVYTGERSDLPPLRCAYVIQPEQRGSGDALLYAQEWVADSPFVVAFGDCIIEGVRGQGSGVREEEETGGGNGEQGTGNRNTIHNPQSAIANPEHPNPRTPEHQTPNTRRPLADIHQTPSPTQRLMAAHLEQQAEATVLVEEVEWAKVSRYGVVAPKQPLSETPLEAFALADIVEKPIVEEAPSNLVVAARWALQPSVFAVLRQTALDARGERNITDAVRALGQAGKALWAVPLRPGEARRDIGNFESFFANFVRAALRDPEFGAAARQAAQQELHEYDSRSGIV